jgi:hypothetical protein
MEMTSHNTLLTPRRDGAAVKYVPAALALAALTLAGTVPAAAATHHHHYHRAAQSHRAGQSFAGLHMYAGESLDGHDPVLGAMPMNESRAQAMHDCNMKAQPYSFSTWETMQFSIYGTCMTEHGQTP